MGMHNRDMVRNILGANYIVQSLSVIELRSLFSVQNNTMYTSYIIITSITPFWLWVTL